MLLKIGCFQPRHTGIPGIWSHRRTPDLNQLCVLVLLLLLDASHSRRAVVDTNAGAVWSGVAPLNRLQLQLRSHQAAAGAAGTVPGFTGVHNVRGLGDKKTAVGIAVEGFSILRLASSL